MRLLIINGPNLNLLVVREPELYGSGSYEELVEYIKRERGSGGWARAAGEACETSAGCEAEGVRGNELCFVQTNHEGVIIDEIQRAHFEGWDGIILNVGGYTHTSIAIMDALKSVKVPADEVHVTDPKSREEYRHHSYVAEAAIASVTGKGFAGYVEAIDILVEYLEGKKE